MNNPNFSLLEVSLPVGAITAFAGKVISIKSSPAPAQPIESFGWMLCDGSTLNASEYPELYTALGGLYGSSESGNDTLFNLPDLRGQFLRGIDTRDPSLDDCIAASLEDRIAAPGGTQDGIGSTQTDAIQTHTHIYTEPTGKPAPGKNGDRIGTVNSNANTDIPVDTPNKAAVKVSQYETRPTNTFVNYLIKYTYKLPGVVYVTK